ncbi:MAG TPA: hypothetical protein VFA97_03150 [Gaiellaceae bacterium]|nr:hypothetical protein [Gaiellaceae bacterium]
MTSFTPKTKAMAATVTSLVALTGAAFAHSANAREVSQNSSALEAQVVRLGQVPNFWAVNCPIELGSATAWAQGDDVEAGALRGDGFMLGVREQLRSDTGETGASIGLEFHSAAEAKADLNRRELAAGHAGYATNFAVLESPSVRAYTVRTPDSTTVRVGFTRGNDEYALTVTAAPGADVDALQQTLATAAGRALSR